MDEVRFEMLYGPHTLDAVDAHTPEVMEMLALLNPELEASEMLMFRLDGRCYIGIEDPSDGYRSSLRALLDLGPGPMTNVFPPCAVVGKPMDPRKSYDGDTREARGVDFVDAGTGKLVLSVGTDNIGDYYPRCVLFFDPKAMLCNAGVGDG